MSSFKSRFEGRRRPLTVLDPTFAPPLLAVEPADAPETGARVEVPAPGVIRITGAPFLSQPTGAVARRFFQRAFAAPEVNSASIAADRGVAEIHYSVSALDPQGQLSAIAN